MSSDSGGSTNATASATNSSPYSSPARRIRSRALTKIASSTDARIAKKASALTSHVEPNSSEKLTSDRVSSSRNAVPSTKKCGLKRRTEVPPTRAAPSTPSSAMSNANARPAR